MRLSCFAVSTSQGTWLGPASAHWHQKVHRALPPPPQTGRDGREGGGGAHPPHSGSQLPDTRGARTHTQRPVPRTLGECVSVAVHHPGGGSWIQRCTYIQEHGYKRHVPVVYYVVLYTPGTRKAEAYNGLVPALINDCVTHDGLPLV